MFWESLRNATAVSVDQPAILPVWRGPVQKLAFQACFDDRPSALPGTNLTIGKLVAAPGCGPGRARNLLVFSK
ncbi:MAG TPA: hypothetical protein VNE00_18145 [Paraburkholderia sp.]|nr:hypothetical protein [Paraburkholderia sp.]